MKITFLVYNIYGIGGTVRTVVNTANYFASKGYTVEIISVRKTSKKPTFNLNKKINLRPLYNVSIGVPAKGIIGNVLKILNKMPSRLIHKDELNYKMFSRYTDWMLKKVLKNLTTDFLITTIPSFNILATKFVKNSILIGQEHAQLSAHSESLRKEIIKSYGKLDCLTVLTGKEYEDYRQYFTEEKLKIYEVPNATATTSLRVNYDNKVIITAGRFVYEKGYDDLVEIYRPISEEFPDWELRIFGGGEDYELIRDKIYATNQYNTIRLFPSSKNVLEEFKYASIFVLPSRFESFGMVLIEAMSLGLPTVSFDTYGPKKIIDEGIDGFIVESQNPSMFTEMLRQLILSESLRRKIGNAAIEKSKRYSFNYVGEKWTNLLSDLKSENEVIT